MIALILKEYWQLVIALILGIALLAMTALYLDKRDQLTAYQSSIQQMAESAAAENSRIARVQLQNLEILRKDYEINEPKIRAAAVSAYLANRLRTNKPSGSSLPTDASSDLKNDGATKECVPPDSFIQDAASDANTVAEYVQYCKLNNCPIKD